MNKVLRFLLSLAGICAVLAAAAGLVLHYWDTICATAATLREKLHTLHRKKSDEEDESHLFADV